MGKPPDDTALPAPCFDRFVLLLGGVALWTHTFCSPLFSPSPPIDQVFIQRFCRQVEPNRAALALNVWLARGMC